MSGRWNRFRERLKGLPLLADGAMGTELYARGVYLNRCFDEVTLSHPDLVLTIHRDYLKAGAEMIETNSFGANRFKLAGFGIADQAKTIARRASELARQAVEELNPNAFVGGSIGPLGRQIEPLGKLSYQQAHDAFTDQAEGLLEGDVDLIVLETFTSAEELKIAIQAVRRLSPEVPILAMITLLDGYRTVLGDDLERIAELFATQPVDAVGFNCTLGPAKLLEAIRQIGAQIDKPWAIMPNAGELEWVEGRLLSRATPEYFAEYTRRLIQIGVKVVGGCCGSTPQHIRAMRDAMRMELAEIKGVNGWLEVFSPEPEVVVPDQPRAPSRLAERLQRGEFLFSVEINPPRSPNVDNLIERIKRLNEEGVEVVNVPDGPRASARISAMVLAHLIQDRTGVEVILHYTCRDRNILGMQSDLLGAEALGVRNILCITGDPPKWGDYPMATAVFDVDSIGLLKIAQRLNTSRDLAGNPIPQGTNFFLGCGANPGASDLQREVERLHRKVEAGARFVMTQP
ncbi:MAG: bifunctional homocysteine S-methyltransferase/methylenetetrahydrofolate reductase, partial [bacterium]